MLVHHDDISSVQYLVAAILIPISSLQRSKHEEVYTERNTFLLPIMTLISLISLRLMAIIFPSKLLNIILLILFAIIGYLSLYSNIFYLIEFFEIEYMIYEEETIRGSEFHEILVDNNKNVQKEHTHHYKSYKDRAIKCIKKLTIITGAVYGLSILTCLIFIFTQSVILSNLLSVSICFHTIREIKLQSTIAGLSLLGILVLYDIFGGKIHEFYEKMTEEIETPVKILFPGGMHVYDLIGFGDIFVPGLYLSLMKKFSDVKKTRYVFWLSVIAYIIGLAICAFYFHLFKKKVPEMLVVVPLVAVFSFLSASVYKKTSELLYFNRSHTE